MTSLPRCFISSVCSLGVLCSANLHLSKPVFSLDTQREISAWPLGRIEGPVAPPITMPYCSIREALVAISLRFVPTGELYPLCVHTNALHLKSSPFT